MAANAVKKVPATAMTKLKPSVNQSRLKLKWNSGTKQSKPPMNNQATPSNNLGTSLAGVKSKASPTAQISTPAASLNLWRVSLIEGCSLTMSRAAAAGEWAPTKPGSSNSPSAPVSRKG